MARRAASPLDDAHTQRAVGNGRGIRARQAQDTRQNILRAATQVFAKHGFAGGRIEQISKLARSHDRMIYYYFGSKEQLFVEVLESIYTEFNIAENTLELDLDRPVDALTQLVHFTWNYYLTHPEFVTLLISENLQRGKHVGQSGGLTKISAAALSFLEQILARGQSARLFRDDVNARDVYLMIASLGYFYNSNRFTLSAFLGENLMDPDALRHWKGFITQMVLRGVCQPETTASGRTSDV